MKYRCYLAGPITGLSYGEAVDWREDFSARISDMTGGRVECVSPLRGKSFLKKYDKIADSYPGEDVMASGAHITARDRYDCKSADAVVFNMLGAQRVSVGTMIEAGWADDGVKPRILVMENNGIDRNVHEHSMLRHCTNFHVTNLDDAALVIARIFVPG